MKLDRVIAVRNNKTVYRDDDRAVKVFVSGTSKPDVINEALNQSRMEETDLAVPAVLEVSVIDGKWSIVSEYISGKTLTQLISEEPQHLNEYIDLFVKIHADIHRTICPNLPSLKDKMLRKIAEADLSTTERERFCELFLEMPEDRCVCHGDFWLSNIIIDERSTPYIIDWSHAACGNKLADIAKTYLLFIFKEEKDIAELYLNKMCEKISVKKREVEKWIPLVATSEMATSKGAKLQFWREFANVDKL